MTLQKIKLQPSFAEEKALHTQGYQLIAGIDEVGRGAIAGPLMAAAVILPNSLQVPWLSTVRDSKRLTPNRRCYLFDRIKEIAVSIGLGIITNTMIDTNGITQAIRMAMKSAISQLSPTPESLLIDYVKLPGITIPQKGIKFGDSLCLSIACASIIAKVSRDNLMVDLDEVYPGYGLARHKGYGTKDHISCLQKLGPSPIHRKSFLPVRKSLDLFTYKNRSQ